MKILKFVQNNLPIILIVLLALFLRFYKLSESFFVSAETGGDLTIARNAIIDHVLPLHGSVSSHSWLYFGPLYWWLLEAFSYLLSFNPLSHAILGRICSLLIVIAVYLFVKKNVNDRTALISAFFVSISPLFMLSARIGRHDSFSILFSAIFLYVLSFSAKRKLVKPFLVGLTLALGINFEYTFLLVVPVLVLFIFIRRIHPAWNDIRKFSFGFIVPFIPLILLEIQTRRPMLSKIILWIPYRILGFMGVIKSDVVVASFASSSYSFWKLVPDSFLIKSSSILTFLLFVPIISAVYLLIYKFRHKTINSGELLLLLITASYIIGLIIHTNPPIHYFSEIYFVPIVLTCYVVNYFWTKRIIKTIFIIFAMIIFMVDMKYYFSSNWFYKDYTMVESSYISQIRVVKKIIEDSHGHPFSFSRVGVFDDWPNAFADNYLYLFSYYEREPVSNAKIKYIIYDDPKKFKSAAKSKKNFKVGPFGVIKLVK